MYDIIDDIINHDWITTGASEQQYIYMICAVLIILFTILFFDKFFNLISSFFKK